MKKAKIKKVAFFNQVTGPLFLDTATIIAETYCEQSILFCGIKTSENCISATHKLKIIQAPVYDTSGYGKRFFSWLRYTFYSIRHVIALDKHTLILVVSNPPILLIILCPILVLMRKRYAILVYDIYPDILINLQRLRPNSILARFWNFLNEIAYEKAEVVFTIGDHMKSVLEAKFDVKKTHAKKIVVMPPWADTELVRPIKKDLNAFAAAHDQIAKFTVMYSGNFGASHDIETILKASLILKHEKDIHFMFIGDGAKKQEIKNFVSDHGAENISILPLQSSEYFPVSIAAGDISIVSLGIGSGKLMVPSKVSYYLAAGTPVIALCEAESDLCEMVKSARGGEQVEPGNPAALAQKITKIKNNDKLRNFYRQNSREASITIFSKNNIVERVLSALGELNSD